MTKSIYKNNLLKYLFSIAMAVLMVLAAEISGEKEIIFPEVAALLIGAWSMNKAPWRVNKLLMVMLMALSSVVGVVIVRYFAVHIFIQVAVAFAFTAIALSLAKSTFVPMISACILPILLGTDSWIYPVSVTILTLIIVSVQLLLEKLKMKEPMVFEPSTATTKINLINWTKRFVIFLAVAAFPLFSGNYYFIAPPIIVCFVEFTSTASPVRKAPLKLFCVFGIAACLGEFARFLNVDAGFPMWSCALIGLILLYLLFVYSGVMFPPAGAMVVLPLIINQRQAQFCSLKAVVGAGIFILLAMLFFKNKSHKK